MAGAQTKPKSNRGTRNADRRNGKAFGKNKTGGPTYPGKTIMGYKKERVEAWAKAAGQTVGEWTANMKALRTLKRNTAASRRRSARQRPAKSA